MKDVLLRFFNTSKIPVSILLVIGLMLFADGLNEAGDFSIVGSWDYWSNYIYTLVVTLIPAITSALDKWLRTQGIYIEQIFNGFRLPESK